MQYLFCKTSTYLNILKLESLVVSDLGKSLLFIFACSIGSFCSLYSIRCELWSVCNKTTKFEQALKTLKGNEGFKQMRQIIIYRQFHI